MHTSVHNYGAGWILAGLAAVALTASMVGCAPASGAQYTRHLHASAQPSFVNATSLAEAQRMNNASKSSGVLAGAISDENNDDR